METIYFLLFVIFPVFFVGFQALLLPGFFFLKRRGWLGIRAFLAVGATIGAAFGALIASMGTSPVSGAVTAVVVAAFGTGSAAVWWYALVKREGAASGDP